MSDRLARKNHTGQVHFLEDELLAGKLKAVEVAHDGRGEVLGLEEFARDLLDIGRRDFLEHGDELLWREMAVEVDMIAREAVHSLAAAFESEQRGAFQMVFRAAKFFVRQRAASHPADN